MPEYVYIDTRLLWLLMFLSTGFLQYALMGAVRAVMHWTRERKAEPAPGIIKLEEHRRERSK